MFGAEYHTQGINNGGNDDANDNPTVSGLIFSVLHE